MKVARAVITEAVLQEAEHCALVDEARAGAVVSFAGRIRNHDHGLSVSSLEYSGHPSAAEVLELIAKEAAQRDGVVAVAVSHRLGHLNIGDAALVAAVSAEHRAEAFATCGWLVDEIKHRLPIWKRQVFADGTEEWVNCP